MSTLFRPAEARDVADLVAILEDAFQLQGKVEKQAAMRRSAEQDWPEYVVLEQHGRVVSVAHIGRHPLRVGEAVVLKGDVGHVGVRSELQGQGLGTRLMAEIIPYMVREGFHVSRLGGLMKFYRRFGYEPFLRRYIRIPVFPMDADLKGVPRSLLQSPPSALAGRVRRYDPSRDHAARHALLQAYDGRRSGALVVTEDPGPPPTTGPDPHGLTFVYEADKALRGFLAGSYSLVNAGDPAPAYCLHEFAMDYAYPEAAEALVKTLMQAAAHMAPTAISARLPYDEQLFQALVDADIAFEVAEMHQAADGNMMQVINLAALLATIAPELTARLQAAGTQLWEGAVCFKLPRQSGALSLSAETVAPADEQTNGLTVTTSHATFIKWLFGISGFAEFPKEQKSLSGLQRLTLNVLFPRLPCASGPWG